MLQKKMQGMLWKIETRGRELPASLRTWSEKERPEIAAGGLVGSHSERGGEKGGKNIEDREGKPGPRDLEGLEGPEFQAADSPARTSRASPACPEI